MSAAKRDITIEKGATFTYQIQIQNSDQTAFDLTGYTVQAEVRETTGNKNLIVAMTGTIPSPATNGLLNLQITAATSDTLREGKYEWDLFIRSGSPDIRLIYGKATIVPSVSKRS